MTSQPTPRNGRAPESPAATHQRLEQRFESERQLHERRDRRLSSLRLLSFLAAAALLTSGALTRDTLQLALGAAATLAFIAFVVTHLRVLKRLHGATIRRDIHRRHMQRITGGWDGFASTGRGLISSEHPYAWDIDLVGDGSLFQRLDVTHTLNGEQHLANWLARPGELQPIARRQAAVAELAPMLELRQELEAAALWASGDDKLDGSGFRKFAQLPSLFERLPWLAPMAIALPLTTLVLYVAQEVGALGPPLWALSLTVQVGLVLGFGRPVRHAFDLASARQGVAEAFEGMLQVAESAHFDSPLLQSLQTRLSPGGTPPSAHMRSLRSWVGYAELRHQFLFHVFINPLLLWDLNVLRGLESWNRRAGRHTSDWFEALGELEALCSLAGLLHSDPQAELPEVVGSEQPLRAEQLGHPLLLPSVRVSNDVALQGPGTAVLVTGSNMAGKSTLLRAVGLNLALALAGGPVCARMLQVPRLRLRASMRAQDSLKRGASYFHAELSKLRSVTEALTDEPPVFFLLDELLRGTNERARHLGAKAVLLHLLARRGTGLVATHDTVLAAMQPEHPDMLRNVHFTDVVVDGEMRFDYRLRPGIVKTSNALRLLSMAGIDVPAADREAVEAVSELPETSDGAGPTGDTPETV